MRIKDIGKGFAVILIFTLLQGCSGGGWTERERTVIFRSDSVMFVTTWHEDSVQLRTPSVDVALEDFQSEELKTLMAKMLRTVTDPSQDGVGIAAPQVGINRRIIWVQRLDKDGEPFECYVNIRIDSLFGDTRRGPEGCLSVPGYQGMVTRNNNVVISYSDLESGNTVKEQIEGYTAVIFQHECDHLEGILYVDRADTVYVNQPWMEELRQYDYTRPGWW